MAEHEHNDEHGEHDDDWFRKYVDAGAALGHQTRARAEAFVRELMGGHDDRPDARQRVEDLIDRGKRASEELMGVVRTEVANQLAALGFDAEHLGTQVADRLRRTASGQRKDTGSPTGAPSDFAAGTWTAGEPAHADTAAAATAPPTAAAAKKATTVQKAATTKAAAVKKAASSATTASPAKKATSSVKKAARPSSGTSGGHSDPAG